MRKMLSNALTVFTLLVGGAELQAADHPHEKGPHGGSVQGFGEKNHMEAVKSGGNVNFYLLDDNAKGGASIAKHQGGNVTILAGKKTEKISIPAGANFSEFSTKSPEGAKVTAILTLKVDGKNVTAKFNLKD